MPKQRRLGKTIAISGRGQRTLRSEWRDPPSRPTTRHSAMVRQRSCVGRQAQFDHLTDVVPVTNTSPLDHTTPLDNTAPTARFGALTLHHPGCGITRVGPRRTPTVHPCPSRWKDRGWLNHARNKCTQRCTPQHMAKPLFHVGSHHTFTCTLAQLCVGQLGEVLREDVCDFSSIGAPSLKS